MRVGCPGTGWNLRLNEGPEPMTPATWLGKSSGASAMAGEAIPTMSTLYIKGRVRMASLGHFTAPPALKRLDRHIILHANGDRAIRARMIDTTPSPSGWLVQYHFPEET